MVLFICAVLPMMECSVKYIKENGYTLKGDNSLKTVFFSLLKRVQKDFGSKFFPFEVD